MSFFCFPDFLKTLPEVRKVQIKAISDVHQLEPVRNSHFVVVYFRFDFRSGSGFEGRFSCSTFYLLAANAGK